MKTKTLKYYSIGCHHHFGDNLALNFESRELANQHVIANLLPKDWAVNVKLSNLTIMKKDKVKVEYQREIYFKNNPSRVKKVVKEISEEDQLTQTHDFTNYLQSERDWRVDSNKCCWDNGTKSEGYYNFKTGEITSEITNQSVIFRAPVSVQFVKAELIVTTEVKVDGQPYQARKEEVKREIASEWLPVYVVEGKGQYDKTKYCIDPEWTDGSWWKGAKPYVAAIEYQTYENKIEIVTSLQ